MMNRWLKQLRTGLTKTRTRIRDQLVLAFSGHLIDPEFWDELEEILIVADLHLDLAEAIVRETRRRTEQRLIKERTEVLPVLIEVLAERLEIAARPLHENPPGVYFFVGVNGTGKTTTIAKVAHRLQQRGHKVMLCAADTFRAAGIEQLQIWADRVGVPVIHHQAGADPAAVLYDALSAFQARGADFLLVDTAGRLHTKTNLMKELEKMGRVARRHLEDAPHETFLVLDATTGQNAVQQARVFREAVPVTGLILTKLDGTAKGGSVISIVDHLRLPVRYLGVGETPDDLLPFDPREFARALVGDPDEIITADSS